MKQTYATRPSGRAVGVLLGSGLGLLLAMPGLVQAQALPQYSLPFNGTNQYAGIPNNPSLEFTTGTIEMWVKPNWTVGTHNRANLCLISERSGATINGGTRFSLHINNDMRAIGIWNSNAYLTVPYTFTKGTWYHIAAVMTTSSTQFFVNGQLIGTTDNGINTTKAGYNLKIGVSETEGTQIGNDEYFEGEIDEVRVWNTARTAAQIDANKGTAISAASPGLLAYYPIDQGITSASNAVARLLKDYTANSLNGTLYNYWTEQAPVITGLLPTRNAVSAARNGNVAITFSQNMNSAAASDAAIRVFGSQTGKRAGTFSGSGTNTIVFDPTQDLRPGETASVIVTTAARSMGNASLATPQIFQFTGTAALASGKLGTATSYQAGNFAIQVTSGDINGDGNVDVLASNYSAGSLSVYLGTGTGTLGSPTVFTGFPNIYNVALGDINNDGRLDAAISTTSNNVSVLLNTGTSALFSAASTVAVGANSERLELGDVNNDGNLDLVVAQCLNGTGTTVRVLPGNGNGTFGTATSYATGPGPYSVTLADFNNDGYLDILAPDYGNPSVSVLLNAGNGTFKPYTSYETTNRYQRRALAVDFNNDGNPDIAVAGAVLLGTGTGTFGTKIDLPASGGTDLTAGDINGDGKADLISPQSVLLGDGQGNFSLSSSINTGAYGLSLADFNNDGRLDLVTADASANTISMRLGLAAPTFVSFTPDNGAVGTTVVLTGTEFMGATSVKFNGTTATNFTVNSATQITATVPNGATTGPISVTTPAGTATSAQAFTVPVITDLVVSDTRLVTGSYRNVTITGTGVATLQGNLNVTGTFVVQEGGSLNLKGNAVSGNAFTLQDGATLTIGGREGIAATGNTGGIQTTTRSFSAEANYVYGSYQQGAVTGSALPARVRSLAVVDLYGDNETYLSLTNDLAISQVLRLNYNLTTAGKTLTLLSTPTDGTALVVNNGGVVDGVVTVQRALDPTLNAGPGYHHFSSPVQGTTVADLATSGYSPVVNPAYNTSATPNLTQPYPTVFSYDAGAQATSPATVGSAFDKGWVSPASLSDKLAVGRGYTVNIPATETVDFVGRLNNGLVSLPLNSGANAEAGWQLVGNPYPSPLDWSQLKKPVEVDDAIYVYESNAQYQGSWRTSINGIGDPVVPAGQGFFVRVNNPNTAATLTFANAARITTFAAQPAMKRGAPETRPLVQLTLRSTHNTLTDDAYVYFQPEATAGIDARYDALKIQHNAGGAPSVYSLSAGKELSINGLPTLEAGAVLPLGVDLPKAGTYTLETTQLLNLAAATVYLVDRETGEQINVAQQPRYTFTTTGAARTNTRFELRFVAGRTLSNHTGLTATSLGVYPNPAHHTVTVSVPAVAGAKQVAATLYNSLGQIVRQQTAALPAAGAQVPFDLRGLPAGAYVLRVQIGQQNLTKQVLVQ